MLNLIVRNYERMSYSEHTLISKIYHFKFDEKKSYEKAQFTSTLQFVTISSLQNLQSRVLPSKNIEVLIIQLISKLN